jgi:probable biosynthetic protein (TIGR04098 family)
MLFDSGTDPVLRSQILERFAAELMTDAERARLFGLPEGCRIRERTKILAPEKLRCGKHLWIGEGAVLDAQGGLEIGDYTQIGSGVLIWTHSSHRQATLGETGQTREHIEYKPTRIGSRVFIGGPSVVLPGVTIGDGAMIQPLSLVNRNVLPNELYGTALEMRQMVRRIEALEAKRLLPSDYERPEPAPKALTVAESGGPSPQARSAQAVAIIKGEIPTFTAADMATPFDRLGIDSMGLLIIRTQLEALAGATIDDGRWVNVITPADLVNALAAASTSGRRQERLKNAAERRTYVLNMPQMAVGGLSESWAFKEFGDIHWSILAKGLQRPSHLLQDGNGERLYATFTRFQLDSTCALASFRESESVQLDASMSRYGAGIYFSDAMASGESGVVRARLSSSFSKAEESNTSLIKGVPELPPDCNIPALAELPEFARDYRARRSESLGQPIFECEYEIIPSHDINGVGLLYFAAYPIINDICATRHAGRSFATQYSTVHRDVFYYGNSDPDDTLLYRLHRWTADDETVDMESSIGRKSDGNLIAHVLTRKVRVGRRDLSRSASSR